MPAPNLKKRTWEARHCIAEAIRIVNEYQLRRLQQQQACHGQAQAGGEHEVDLAGLTNLGRAKHKQHVYDTQSFASKCASALSISEQHVWDYTEASLLPLGRRTRDCARHDGAR
jgi:hypothetical protein